METLNHITRQTFETQVLLLKSETYVCLKIRKTVSELQNNLEFRSQLRNLKSSPDFGNCTIELWYDYANSLTKHNPDWNVEVEGGEVKFAKNGPFQTPTCIRGEGVGSYILNELVKFVLNEFPASTFDRKVQLDSRAYKDPENEDAQLALSNWYAEWGLYPNESVSSLEECPNRYLDKGLSIIFSEDYHSNSLLKNLKENQRVAQNSAIAFQQLNTEVNQTNHIHQLWRAAFLSFASIEVILFLLPKFTNLSVVGSITELVSISYIVICFFFWLWSRQYY